MKLLLSCLVMLFASAAAAGTRYWDGEAGDGLWQNPSNWTGDLLPAAGDDVILDNSIVTGNYTVTLPSGAVTVSVNSILVAPSGGANIIVVLPASNTANPGLQVTGPADALILQPGSILKNSSGASAGSGISISNRLRINNGATYIHNTRRSNAAIVSQLSTASGTELGEFEFDVPPSGSYTPSLSGRNYGTLSFSSAASGGAITYAGSGASDLVIRGHLNINSGATLSISMTADINVSGNFTQAPGSTLNLQTSSGNDTLRLSGNLHLDGVLTESGSGLPVIELNGSGTQLISGSGSISGSVNFRMNSAAGGSASLAAPLSLPFALTLSNGRILTTATNPLTLSDNAIVSGGSVASFVQGPMSKAGDEDFVFPLGSGTIYAPLSILNGAGQSATDTFTAEYRRANPQAVYGNSYSGGIHHISFVEYWLLSRNSGSASKRVALAVHEQSFCLNPSTTFLSRFDGAQWTNETSAPSGFSSCGAYQCGTLTSNDTLTQFGPFTIATSDPVAVNPLPLSLLSFRVLPRGDSLVFIWEMAEAPPPGTRFALQSARDGQRFADLVMVTAGERVRHYELRVIREDVTCRYRLQLRTGDGSTQTGPVLTIRGSLEDIGPLIPNPVQSFARVSINASRPTEVIVRAHDLSGTCVYLRRRLLLPGAQQLELDLSSLPAGPYLLRVAMPGRERTFRIVKN